MKISEILQNKNQGISFEFFPPKSDKGKQALEGTINELKSYQPLYASMTYGAGGTTQNWTKEAVDMLLQAKTVEVMPHLTSIGSSQEEVDLILEDYHLRGIQNIMALRGDPPLDVENFNFKSQEFSYAFDLVRAIKRNGNFCIGVAVYPEGHIETDSLEKDMSFTKQKIDAGADFGVTQMFFDNKYYYDFLERASKSNIKIPILPGILPLTDVAKVKQFAAVCRTTIPVKIENEMARFSDCPEDMEKVGIDFTIKQCQDLIANGVKKLHFFTLNKPQIIKTILEAIG